MLTKAPPIAAPTAFSWAGYYGGLNAGWGWVKDPVDLGAAPGFAAVIAVGQTPLSVPLEQNGFIGGGQVGYNWQSGVFVTGLEADFQGSNLRGSGSFFYTGPAFPVLTNVNSELDWFGTFRGRVGFTPIPTVLLFATGGLAYGQIKSNTSQVAITAPAAGNFHGSASDTNAGWTIGGGAEWAILPRWTVKAEYLHIDLGQSTVNITDPAFPGNSAAYVFKDHYDIARAGFNYKF
jgi:outer membrane immunogenic protein